VPWELCRERLKGGLRCSGEAWQELQGSVGAGIMGCGFKPLAKKQLAARLRVVYFCALDRNIKG